MKGLVVLIILDFWALWSALSSSWSAIDMSVESEICAASDSIENINSDIVVTVMAAITAVMVMIVMNVMHNWCCIGVNAHWFWSVWLDMFVVSDWLVMVAR